MQESRERQESFFILGKRGKRQERLVVQVMQGRQGRQGRQFVAESKIN
jgi:hypothetical protein